LGRKPCSQKEGSQEGRQEEIIFAVASGKSLSQPEEALLPDGFPIFRFFAPEITGPYPIQDCGGEGNPEDDGFTQINLSR
jgi:hypothetical protein